MKRHAILLNLDRGERPNTVRRKGPDGVFYGLKGPFGGHCGSFEGHCGPFGGHCGVVISVGCSVGVLSWVSD